MAGLPRDVTIWEVGPRDGLQNEQQVVSTDTKRELVERLAAAGLPVIEVTSFVSPVWVPQLADADEVFGSFARESHVRYPVLVPNERGMDRAMAGGARDIAVFASATETFARRNLNRGLDDQYEMFAPVVERAARAGIGVRGYLSMCFGDPWEGDVATRQVVEAAVRLVELGCDSLSLGDTIGVATPGHVR